MNNEYTKSDWTRFIAAFAIILIGITGVYSITNPTIYDYQKSHKSR